MTSEPAAPESAERRTRSEFYTPPSSRPKGPLTSLQKGLVSLGFFLFRGYIGLVKLTSRLDLSELDVLFGPTRSGKNAISAILHQDVIISAFLYQGRRIVSMVSTS